MSIQKLHYENLGGILVRREGLLTWRCPLCKAEGQSPKVMRTCPECGSKEATLPGAQPAPSVQDEDAAFRDWLNSEASGSYVGVYEFAKAAWMARAALAAPEAKP